MVTNAPRRSLEADPPGICDTLKPKRSTLEILEAQ
jgi:hypothetical protein